MVSVPIQMDEEGYFDRECPREECGFVFKIHGEDWSNVERDQRAFCPACREEADSKSWHTTEQLEEAKRAAIAWAKHQVGKSLQIAAQEFNRRQAGRTFFSMSMVVTGVARSHVILPISAVEEMILKATCEACGCRYAFIGSAFFCPACGANSAEQTFDQAMVRLRRGLGVNPLLTALDKDASEQISATFRQSAITGGVTSFQSVAERLYERVSGRIPPKNAFQRLVDGSDLWKQATGVAYVDLIGAADLDRLKLYFQRRHVLAHRDGLVDPDYVIKSGDTSYKAGQRLVTRVEDAEEFLTLVERLVAAMRASLSPPRP